MYMIGLNIINPLSNPKQSFHRPVNYLNKMDSPLKRRRAQDDLSESPHKFCKCDPFESQTYQPFSLTPHHSLSMFQFIP